VVVVVVVEVVVRGVARVKFAGKGSTRNPRDTAFWTRSSRLQAKAEALGSVGYKSRVEVDERRRSR
jgi:hypothetical protein